MFECLNVRQGGIYAALQFEGFECLRGISSALPQERGSSTFACYPGSMRCRYAKGAGGIEAENELRSLRRFEVSRFEKRGSCVHMIHIVHVVHVVSESAQSQERRELP